MSCGENETNGNMHEVSGKIPENYWIFFQSKHSFDLLIVSLFWILENFVDNDLHFFETLARLQQAIEEPKSEKDKPCLKILTLKSKT